MLGCWSLKQISLEESEKMKKEGLDGIEISLEVELGGSGWMLISLDFLVVILSLGLWEKKVLMLDWLRSARWETTA